MLPSVNPPQSVFKGKENTKIKEEKMVAVGWQIYFLRFNKATAVTAKIAITTIGRMYIRVCCIVVVGYFSGFADQPS